MSPFLKKLIAVLLAIWLPLMTGNSLAASIPMQLQQGSCHEMDEMQAMEGHHHSAADQDFAQPGQDQSDGSCSNCGICHLACSGYLAVPGINAPTLQQDNDSLTPYLLSFHSITSIPLLPPPLSRA